MKEKLRDKKKSDRVKKKYYKELYRRKFAEYERDFYINQYNQLTSQILLAHANLGLPAAFIEGACEVVDEDEELQWYWRKTGFIPRKGSVLPILKSITWFH